MDLNLAGCGKAKDFMPKEPEDEREVVQSGSLKLETFSPVVSTSGLSRARLAPATARLAGRSARSARRPSRSNAHLPSSALTIS